MWKLQRYSSDTTIARIYGKLLKTKLEEEIDGKIGNEQADFSAEKSYIDQQIIEKKVQKTISTPCIYRSKKSIRYGTDKKIMEGDGKPQNPN